MNKKRFISLALAIIMLMFLLVGCGGSDNPPQSSAPPASSPVSEGTQANASGLDLGGYTADDPLVLRGVSFGIGERSSHNVDNVAFSEDVFEASGGAVVIEVYNDAILTQNDRDTFEGLQLGNFDIGFNNTAVLTNYIDEYKVLDIPYLFNGPEHTLAFLESDVMLEMVDLLEETGVVCLGLTLIGFRFVNAVNDPILTPDDFNGVLIRVIESDVYIDTFRAFGANTIAMAASEVLVALQQGTIDAFEGTPIICHTGGYSEFTKKISRTYHAAQFTGINVSKRTWDTLPPGVQQLLRETALKTGMRRSIENIDENEYYVQVMTDEMGVEFFEVDVSLFRDRVASVHATYSAQFSELFDKIMATDPAA